jgi:hypothetical protein
VEGERGALDFYGRAKELWTLECILI